MQALRLVVFYVAMKRVALLLVLAVASILTAAGKWTADVSCCKLATAKYSGSNDYTCL